MEPGKTLRATLGKPPHERLVSNHAGKTKRIDQTLKSKLETEYGAGSVWLNQRLMASATRAAPHRACQEGKPPRSWIDLQTLSTILNTSEKELAGQWADLMAY